MVISDVTKITSDLGVIGCATLTRVVNVYGGPAHTLAGDFCSITIGYVVFILLL